MRIGTKLVLMGVLTSLAASDRAAAARWDVAGVYAVAVRVRSPGTHVVRQQVPISFGVTIAPDRSYEITGPFALCEGEAGFQPRGPWRGSERALLAKALRATLLTMLRGCSIRGPVRVSALTGSVRIAGDFLTGRLSARATLRASIRPPSLGGLMLHGRVTGTRLADVVP